MPEVVGSLFGAAIIGDSNKSAANKQAKAANNATALQKDMFDTVNAQEAPYRSLGYGALNQLATLLGVQPVAASGGPAPQGPAFEAQEGLWGVAPPRPADTPYMPGLQSNPSDPQFGMLMRQFQPGDLSSDPGYQFRLAEGTKAINSNAGARGGLYSGSTLKALQDYGQGFASTEFQNAFNRDAATKDRFVNYLTSAAGMGSNAAGRTQTAAQQFATNAGNNLMGAANVSAASTLARGNMFADTANNMFARANRGGFSGWDFGGFNGTNDRGTMSSGNALDWFLRNGTGGD